MSLATVLLGPLVGPECRRALARGWLIVIRTLASCAVLGVALAAVWWWWINRNFIDSAFTPYETLRAFLMVCEGMLVTIALLMSPALLAGSLAGERERGALGLLLTTRVSAREIVLGRLIGKLTQVGMVLLACVPAVVLLAALAGFRLSNQAVLLALPAAVAFGGCGLAAAASAVSKRGRDALLAVYLVEVLFLLSPLAVELDVPREWAGLIGTLNPFVCLDELALQERKADALITIGLWTALGLFGITVASWRLRPSCLGTRAGERGRRNARRYGWVPPLDERPMLWKELYIERAGTLGRFGRWLGIVFILGYGGACLYYAGEFADARWWHLDMTREADALSTFSTVLGASALYVGWLIQLAIGLRAAVTIASERERGTWDALMTSPLEGGEIVRAKLWGSVYALRGIVAVVLTAWSLATLCGALTPSRFFELLANTAILGTYMAAIGVRTSLASSTATKAMALTVGLWLGGQAVVYVISGILLGAIGVAILSISFVAVQLGYVTWGTFPVPTWLMRLSLPLTYHVMFVIVTFLIVADTRLRFDRIAGRMTEGRAGIILDRMIHGSPAEQPVYLESPR